MAGLAAYLISVGSQRGSKIDVSTPLAVKQLIQRLAYSRGSTTPGINVVHNGVTQAQVIGAAGKSGRKDVSQDVRRMLWSGADFMRQRCDIMRREAGEGDLPDFAECDSSASGPLPYVFDIKRRRRAMTL